MNDRPPTSESVPTEIQQPARRKPGLLRKSAIILILVLIALVILAFPLAIEPWLVKQVRTSLKNNGMELAEDSTLDISVFGGQLKGAKIRTSETVDGETRTLFTADELNADVAVLDSLTHFDLIIDELKATGVTGNLRRRKDGSVPVITPKDEKGTDWGTMNWYDYYKKIEDWYKKRKDEEEQSKKEPEKRPEPKPEKPADWPDAVAYKPAPKANERGPRMLIRKLTVEVKHLGLPDDTPFDVTEFVLDGVNVCLQQLPEETMILSGHGGTKGAGGIAIGLERLPGETGKLVLMATGLPAEVLASDAVSGGHLTKYGPSGTTDLNLKAEWNGFDLSGTLTNVLKNFQLNPKSDAGSEAQQAAAVIKRLGGRDITWPMKLGGTLFAPVITDSGVDDLVKGGLKDAVKEEAKARATEEADKALKKQLDKNPDAKKATDFLKGLGK
jgi:hypothetical protein